ncbi:MAG: hypothetical protein ABSG75_17685 [Syntrophales bacterium]|jgi:hypothetical protein
MRVLILKVFTILAVCLSIVPAYAQEEDYRSVEALKSLGVRSCASAVRDMTKFMYDKDDFAYLNLWNKVAIDKHMSFTITSKPYADGKSIAALAVSPTPAGTCDINFVQFFATKESCPKLRDTTFKEWKYYADLGGTPMYEDSTFASSIVALVSAEGGCLIVKTGLLFLDADMQK